MIPPVPARTPRKNFGEISRGYMSRASERESQGVVSPRNGGLNQSMPNRSNMRNNMSKDFSQHGEGIVPNIGAHEGSEKSG